VVVSQEIIRPYVNVMAGFYAGLDRANVIAQVWSARGRDAGQNGSLAHKKLIRNSNWMRYFTGNRRSIPSKINHSRRNNQELSGGLPDVAGALIQVFLYPFSRT
jgi:hypothetical protein